MGFVEKILLDKGISKVIAGYLSFSIELVLLIIICLLANFITKRVVLNIISKTVYKNNIKWDDFLVERKVFHRISNIVPFAIIYMSAPIFGSFKEAIQRIVQAIILVISILVVSAILNAIDDVYKTYPISKIRPITGTLQIVKILSWILIGIALAATLSGTNPIAILSGIGVLSALITIMFKDPILGFVAGIQLTTNNMIQIGDWVEMTKYGANGHVVEIHLSTIKIRNFDQTIISVPAYAFLSDSFKNWRGISEAGGRRIMRSILIDISSIRFCSEEMIENFKKINYLKDYIIAKEEEFKKYNNKDKHNMNSLMNGKHLTNIACFRAYIEEYLKSDPRISKEHTIMARQLAPNENGLPIEIYAFATDIDLKKYEEIQFDIFDHLFAVVNEFQLRIFQNPSGYDIKQIGKIL
ncbi:mechanosensitive ion channel [Clostridium sp. PL3]|uniref:Mechanosensitive ion channel n=1 Tax=Clostridium thailandense TaxID=2794346 RepID=A0A949WSE5_9CLOT|nr:mechanosensitive ion channel domain-containing protein [Clostridium thailandense]MBV7275090.1 mechanosensitive ion channel [Clostridium thailandense]